MPKEITNKFYGCGNPIPLGITGKRVLDLGSGSGRDCYIAAKIVGEHGHVVGVDMTDEQIDVANAHIAEYTNKLGYAKPNLSFKKGYIEFLEKAGIEANSIDLVISNCVVNLSPNKLQVLKSVYSVLKEGGEFHFSDVYCDRRLPENVTKHKVLYGECIAGALYVNDFVSMSKQVGFKDPRVLSKSEIVITDPTLLDVVGAAKFYSITYRLFKLPALEAQCEDYGQIAYYKGTIPGTSTYALDDHHAFETNKPVLVCSNTASMLADTWLGQHFKIVGDTSTHFGAFPCGPVQSDKQASACDTNASCCS